MATTAPQNLKHDRPPSGLIGWSTAFNHLDKIENDRQRDILGALVRNLGVVGAPAMEYAAWSAMWLTGLRKDPPVPRKALKTETIRFIERRVREDVAVLDRKLFPKMIKSVQIANNVVPIQVARRG